MSAGNRIGDVLASKYRLEELLGSGGMGHVYRAVNVEIDREVAIKVLRSEHSLNASIVERFLREARAANLVRHPNVVDVVDIGRDSDGSPFIVQELLKGEDLAKFVERRGGKLTLAEIEDLILPVIDAVAEAHARGVVHRDLKPENVFLADQGRRRVPKLLDFGISKIRVPNVKATEVGVMMGTPAYMAPEQVQGARDADARCDVWALGIVLFELILGRMPFDVVDAPAMFVAIATKAIPRPSEVDPTIDPAVSKVIERCLRRLPDDRYPSAAELARDLRHALEGEELESTQTRSMPPPGALLDRPTMPDPPAKPQLRVSDLGIPDLVVPTPKAAAKTIAGTPPGPPQPKTFEREPPRLGLEPESGAAARPPSRPDPPPAAASSGRLPKAKEAPMAPLLEPVGSMFTPRAPPAQPQDPMQGMMHGGTSPVTPRRAIPSAHEVGPPTRNEPPEMSFLVALGVMALTTVGATAVLMTFVYQPDGWPLVSYVTKPSSSLNLLVQGGLGLAALIVAGRFVLSGYRKWRGDAMGGRGSAIGNAVVAGGLLFAAVELVRAAW